MEDFLFYIGKAALASGAFYLVYLALFQHQKHFVFNRIYLPVSLAISFLIPFITFTTVHYIQAPETNSVSNTFAYLPVSASLAEPEFKLEWYHYLTAFYIFGISVFLIHLLLGHLKAINIIRFSRLKELFGARVNLTEKDVHPFSFFKRIVLSEKTLDNPNLKIIVDHERVHVQEYHTFDILFSEILFLFQWFNPFAWLIKAAIRDNLEFKTDDEITKNNNAEAYQLAMVGLAHKEGVAPFLTALNGSQLKNRIIMMKKKTENRYSLLKQMVVLPLLAVLIMGLSNKEVKTEIVRNQKEVKIVVDGKEIPNNDPSLASIDFSNGFEGGEIVDALKLKNKVESNFLYVNEDTDELAYYIRTSDYVPGSNTEFDKITSDDEQSGVESYKAPKMLYAIDGKIIETTDAKIVGKQDYESASILTGNDAVEKYGEQANDASVLELKTGKPNVKVYSNQSLKELTIKGKITNEKGEPVPAVAVLVEGTTNGTISDPSGNYEIHTPENSTLIFSMVGFEKKEVVVDGRTEINVELENDLQTQNGQRIINVAPKDESTVENEEYRRVINFDTGEEVVINAVRGKVSNDKGEPIPGAAVLIKGTTSGTITDFEGNFELQIQSETKSALMFSMVGYQMKEVDYEEQPRVDVVLEADENANPDEIKVIGYGEQKKGSELLERVKIHIAGEQNEPLYFVDGIENKNIDWLAPDQIENVSVLKGETANALYGDKGKNGVVIVTTKFAPKEKLNEALMIVDGKIYDGDINDFDPESIESIDVLKDASATKMYGPKGKNGAIIIKTKNVEEFNGKSPKVIVDGKEYKGDINDIPVENISSIEVRKNQPDRNIYDGKGPEEDKIIIQTKTKYNSNNGNPLIFIDGEKYSGDMDDIDPESIQSVDVLKDPASIETYGEEAKDGVILITTKSISIKSALEFRKFIASKIKYPVSAQEANQEGIAQLFVKVGDDGIIKSVSDKKMKDAIYLDEVIATSLGPKEDEIQIQSAKKDLSDVFNKELKRVINQLPKIEDDEFLGKTLAVTVKFVLE